MIVPPLKGEYLTNHRYPATRNDLTTFHLKKHNKAWIG